MTTIGDEKGVVGGEKNVKSVTAGMEGRGTERRGDERKKQAGRMNWS